CCSPRASSWCGPSPAPGAPLRAGAQNEPGHPFHWQFRPGHEPLDPPIIALGIGTGVESGRKLGIIDSADLAQGRDKMTDKTDPGQVEKAPEMAPEHLQ